MKEKKIKVIAIVISLFAACGGISSAMETSKSEKNSKMNLKSDQNNNKTENNKLQSDGKRNQNTGIQIPYYAYPMGYLGLNEIGGLLGFDYLLFGKYGIIKGAKYLLSDEKVEVKQGQYWQHNYNMIMSEKTIGSYHTYNEKFKKTMERIMKWPNEKILLGEPTIRVNGNYQSLGNINTGFSYEDFLKDLRGNRKIAQASRRAGNTFEFFFEGINDKKFQLSFGGGFWDDISFHFKPSITLEKSSGDYGKDRVSMSFSVQPGLYSW